MKISLCSSMCRPGKAERFQTRERQTVITGFFRQAIKQPGTNGRVRAHPQPLWIAEGNATKVHEGF